MSGLSMSEMMDSCLLGKRGYFKSKRVEFGQKKIEGHEMVTISQFPFYAEACSFFLQNKFKDGLHVVEFGPGNGNFLLNLYNYFGTKNTDYTGIEPSPILREAQTKLLKGTEIKISEGSIDNQSLIFTDNKPTVIFLNEVLDNYPASACRKKSDQWYKLAITKNGFSEILIENPETVPPTPPTCDPSNAIPLFETNPFKKFQKISSTGPIYIITHDYFSTNTLDQGFAISSKNQWERLDFSNSKKSLAQLKAIKNGSCDLTHNPHVDYITQLAKTADFSLINKVSTLDFIQQNNPDFDFSSLSEYPEPLFYPMLFFSNKTTAKI